ncbi:MAG: hypothetical protein R8M38_04520 [Mariprofundaceae bacterium]
MLASTLKTPKPENWQGVGAGLASASQAFQRCEYQQAIDALHSVLEFSPAEGRAWHLLGKAHQHIGDHKAALNSFKQAKSHYVQLEQEEMMPLKSLQIAKALWNQGCQQEAQSMVQDLLAECPDDQRLHALSNTWRLSA